MAARQEPSARQPRIIADAAISADGRHAITGDWNGLVRIWTLSSGAAVLRLPHPETRDARYSPDGTHLVTIGVTNFAQLWQLPGGKPMYRFHHEPFVSHASFSPDGKLVVTAGWDGLVHLWDVATGKPVATLRHQGRVVQAVFSPDGQTVVTAGFEDGSAGVLEVATGREPLRLKHEGGVRSIADPFLSVLAISPDSRLLVTSSRKEKSVQVRTIPDLGIVARLLSDDDIFSGVFNKQGSKLLTAGRDKTARIWDANTWQEIARVAAIDFIYDASFSPDEKSFVTACGDGEARVWAADLDDMVDLARRRLRRDLTPEESRQYLGNLEAVSTTTQG